MATDFLEDLAGDAQNLLARFTGKKQMIRAVASAFAMSYADGDSDQSERVRAVKILQAKLPQFKAVDVMKEWNKWEEQVQALGFDLVKADLINVIKKAGEDEGRFLITLVIKIAEEDGDFDDDEKAMVRLDFCPLWGYTPEQFRL